MLGRLQGTEPLLHSLGTTLCEIVVAKNIAVPVIAEMLVWEIINTTDRETIFNEDTLAQHLFTSYVQLIGHNWLSCIRPVIQSIARAGNISCEVVQSRMTAHDDLKKNFQHLLIMVSSLALSIFDSDNLCPKSIKSILHLVRSGVKAQFPEQTELIYTSLGGLILRKFFIPAVMKPGFYGLSDIDFEESHVERTTTLVARVLQKLSNFEKFEEREAHLDKMNPFLEENIPTMKKFLDRISEKCDVNDVEQKPVVDYYAALSRLLDQIHLNHITMTPFINEKQFIKLLKEVESLQPMIEKACKELKSKSAKANVDLDVNELVVKNPPSPRKKNKSNKEKYNSASITQSATYQNSMNSAAQQLNSLNPRASFSLSTQNTFDIKVKRNIVDRQLRHNLSDSNLTVNNSSNMTDTGGESQQQQQQHQQQQSSKTKNPRAKSLPIKSSEVLTEQRLLQVPEADNVQSDSHEDALIANEDHTQESIEKIQTSDHLKSSHGSSSRRRHSKSANDNNNSNVSSSSSSNRRDLSDKRKKSRSLQPKDSSVINETKNDETTSTEISITQSKPKEVSPENGTSSFKHDDVEHHKTPIKHHDNNNHDTTTTSTTTHNIINNNKDNLGRSQSATSPKEITKSGHSNQILHSHSVPLSNNTSPEQQKNAKFKSHITSKSEPLSPSVKMVPLVVQSNQSGAQTVKPDEFGKIYSGEYVSRSDSGLYICFKCRKIVHPLVAPLSILERFYHPSCFTCSKCKKSVIKEFWMLSSDLYCQSCIEKEQSSLTQQTSSESTSLVTNTPTIITTTTVN
eukprot:TRINITY_DN3288_c0_g1_i1.p1 TRINITY_DN3288_c0_g1~~TRINITY_DN3288_c0_g1_i1.p1  ORF type:complete len:797 (-),score=189.26 TRINITY_DN3288_c0_g1_i1:94-2484(-)